MMRFFQQLAAVEQDTSIAGEPVEEPPTWCPPCWLMWLEQSDWHGIRPDGESQMCERHRSRYHRTSEVPGDPTTTLNFRYALVTGIARFVQGVR